MIRRAISRLVEYPILIAALIGFLPLFMDALGCSFTPGRQQQSSSVENAYMCSCSCDAPQSTSGPVAMGSDDATERSNTSVVQNETFLHLEHGNLVGVRFAGVQIPTGVTIQSAHLQFTASRTDGGTVVVNVAAQAAGDAGPITSTNADLSSRTPTGASVAWNIAPWTVGESADAERSPDLKDVIQEVVNGGGWAPGHALLLLVDYAGGGGSRRPDSFEGGMGARLDVAYHDPAAAADFTLSVCMPDADNPNLNGGQVVDDSELVADCAGRVSQTVDALGTMCKYTTGCVCQVSDPMRFVDASCDAACPADDLAADCSNFDPQAGHKTANHVPGSSADPVCLVESSDPPNPVPDALAGGLFGRRSLCEASGTAEVLASGQDPRMPGASAVLTFTGDPCPGQTCDVGLSYLAYVDPFHYDGGFLGAGATKISDVTVSGATPPTAIALDTSGAGSIAAEDTFSTGRGRRQTSRVILSDIDKRQSYTGTNGLPVGVSVDWANAQCRFQGTLLGGQTVTDDNPDQGNQATSSDLTVNVDVSGPIVNQPPFANAGPDANVECTSPAGAPVLLDGSQSSDFDQNLRFARWTEGSRTGPDVGFALTSHTALGLDQSDDYFLTVVDDYGQASTDSVHVAVVDTTPPVLTPPADVTAECSSPNGTPVSLGSPFVADLCDPAPTVVNDAPALFPLGTTVVTWTATDASGNANTATQNVVVQDTTPPQISSLSVAPTSLWPPNHKLNTITADVAASDICDPNPAVQLVSVLSSEPDDGLADGATRGDVQGTSLGTDDRSFEVRAERQGKGGGRVYTATYQAVDGSGNVSAPASADIHVAKSQGH